MKRRRTGYSTYKVAKQHVNKKILYIEQAPTTTQASTLLSGSSTTAYTFKMNKISISAVGTANQATLVRWAIIKVPSGYTLNTLGVVSGSSFYNPEQDVLAFGTIALADSDLTGDAVNTQNFKLKASRKIADGDVIYFVTDTNNATAISVLAVVQFVEIN